MNSKNLFLILTPTTSLQVAAYDTDMLCGRKEKYQKNKKSKIKNSSNSTESEYYAKYKKNLLWGK